VNVTVEGAMQPGDVSACGLIVLVTSLITVPFA
jgi:hypothetical protein